MKYDELRNIAGDGDVIFLRVNRKNILSLLVSKFTGSVHTHAAFVFWLGSRLMLIESTTHGGIRIVLASTYSDREFDRLSAPMEWEKIADSALIRSGTTKYGWFSAMYIGLRDFCKTHFNINLPINSKNHNKACSEFVAEILKLEDVDISPGKLYRILVDNKNQ